MTARRTFTARVLVGTFVDSVALGAMSSPDSQNVTLSRFPSTPLAVFSFLCKFFLCQLFKCWCSPGFHSLSLLFSPHPFQSPRGSRQVLGICVDLSPPAFILSSNLRLALQAAVPAASRLVVPQSPETEFAALTISSSLCPFVLLLSL